MSYNEEPPATTHVDFYAKYATNQERLFFLGHGDGIDTSANSTLRMRQMATLMHKLAWDMETAADDIDAEQQA